MKPRLAITMGDVNGVGPEILAKALAKGVVLDNCSPVILGDAGILERAICEAGKGPHVAAVSSPDESVASGVVPVFNAGFPAPRLRPGQLDPEAGRCAIEWVKRAVSLAISGAVSGFVTCPLHKECIHRAGYPYTGHTELIAEMTGSPDYRMCLFAGTMRLLHITSHLSLREALDEVRRPRIVKSIQIAQDALLRMGLPHPRIAVAGLNPHAGEAGAFGREEIEEIAPAIAQCQQDGVSCTGPYPPDTVFRRMRNGEFDMVIAMYHDQGHIPLKLIAMDEGVNVTLGIPVVRTSVDHGTAFDIAWRGLAREYSLCSAITLAVQLAGCKPFTSTPES